METDLQRTGLAHPAHGGQALRRGMSPVGHSPAVSNESRCVANTARDATHAVLLVPRTALAAARDRVTPFGCSERASDFSIRLPMCSVATRLLRLQVCWHGIIQHPALHARVCQPRTRANWSCSAARRRGPHWLQQHRHSIWVCRPGRTRRSGALQRLSQLPELTRPAASSRQRP